jgi:nitroreductase
MDAIDAILTRRSIRKYRQDTVPEESVKLLLQAAMSAPSASNGQPWHFIVINSRKILDEIAIVHPNAHMLSGAPMAILVCGEERSEERKDRWVQDCSAATENILIAANALGLGCVWIGVYPAEDRVNALKNLMRIPAGVAPFSLVVVGYPAEMKPPSDRFNQEKIHLNLWDSTSIMGVKKFSAYLWLKMRIRRLKRGLLPWIISFCG